MDIAIIEKETITKDFESKTVPEPRDKYEPGTEVNIAGIVAFCMLFFFFLGIPLLIAFILGGITVVKMKEEPNRYSNKWMTQCAY